jgi:2-haloacid dehalogenase
MPPPAIKAVTFDAYGTLVRNEDLLLVPRRIVADHGLSVAADDVWREWSELYHQHTTLPPFRTLRELEGEILTSVLRQLGVGGDPAPYVDLFFQVTTHVELYPEALGVLAALPPLRAAVVSNADQEHVAAWTFALPVEFVLISEHARAYKPDRLMFQMAVQRLGLAPHEVLHVGDSEVDDVQGAKAAGLRVAWVNRAGRARRPDTPVPDFEIRDLSELPALLPR